MQLILKYFPSLTSHQQSQLKLIPELYNFWNPKINLVSRKDIDQLYERHVLHSIGIARYVNFVPGTSVMDAGTGGGFPGIPLAILFPGSSFLLVDSVAKKINAVNGIIKSLELSNSETVRERIENVDKKFDFIVSRAVTRLPDFVSWTGTKILAENKNDIPNGILYLKGGDFADELKATGMKYNVVYLADYFEGEYFTTKKIVHLFD